MTGRQQDLWRWLEAENEAGDRDAADTLFAAVASARLPLLDVPAGLTERIMSAAARSASARPARWLAGLMASRWTRAAVGAALLILGAAVAIVGLGQFITVGAMLTAVWTGGRAVLDTVSTAWTACTTAWPVMVSLGQTAAAVTATRTAVLLILANVVLATGAFAGLSRLLSSREEES